MQTSIEYRQYNDPMQKLNEQFVKPRYDEGGFAGIPNHVISAFKSENYDAVVLFLVDGFGWRFYERFQDNAFIQRITCRSKRRLRMDLL